MFVKVNSSLSTYSQVYQLYILFILLMSELLDIASSQSCLEIFFVDCFFFNFEAV